MSRPSREKQAEQKSLQIAIAFIFDRGCFHHIRPLRREKFIQGLHRVLVERGRYFMTCFSWRNGPA